jgi:alcohol dehydrogenase (cytochrome c)
MLFRGTTDGRVLAYDFKTGKRLWETTIARVPKLEYPLKLLRLQRF